MSRPALCLMLFGFSVVHADHSVAARTKGGDSPSLEMIATEFDMTCLSGLPHEQLYDAALKKGWKKPKKLSSGLKAYWERDLALRSNDLSELLQKKSLVLLISKQIIDQNSNPMKDVKITSFNCSVYDVNCKSTPDFDFFSRRYGAPTFQAGKGNWEQEAQSDLKSSGRPLPFLAGWKLSKAPFDFRAGERLESFMI